MSRKSSLESTSYNPIPSVLSRLRGSLTKADMSSTDRFKRRNPSSSINESLDFPSVLRNSQYKNITDPPSSNPLHATSLKKLFKSTSKSKPTTTTHTTTPNPKQILYKDFARCIAKLDHTKHSHVGENQCFLGYKCFITIMSQMGYLENWKSDSVLMDLIWKDLGGDDNGGFLKSNLLLLLEMVEGVAGMEGKGREGDREQQQMRTEKNRKMYGKYGGLRENRNGYKNRSGCTETRKFKDREEINENNLSRLRKSLMNRSGENSAKQPIKLRKKDKKDTDLKKLSQTLKSELRKQTETNPHHLNNNKSYRVNLKLDIDSKIVKFNEQSEHKVQSKSCYNNSLSQCERSQTEALSASHHFTSPFVEEESEELLLPAPASAPKLFFPPRVHRVALLSLDINLGEGKTDKIIVYEGDTPKQIAGDMAKRHSLSSEVCAKFQKILESHLDHILSKIQEVEEATEDLSYLVPESS